MPHSLRNENFTGKICAAYVKDPAGGGSGGSDDMAHRNGLFMVLQDIHGDETTGDETT